MNSITIKIGSNVLTAKDSTLNLERIEHLVDQIAQIKKEGKQVILVSSGAVASGRSSVKFQGKGDPVSERQMFSAIGQVKLLNIYTRLFEKHGITIAQVLVTKEDFRTRQHYLNMKNCLSTLLEHNILPIINENDAVSVTALMFTDNDELSGLIASMMDCDSLFILSNVDGIYDGDPSTGTAQVIRQVGGVKDDLSSYISTTKSNFGRGGMLTKCRIAQKVASSGISVHIANGTKPNIIESLANHPEDLVHTHFLPGEAHPAIKKWIAYSDGFAKASVVINQGAYEALSSSKARSLLLPGVVAFDGNFEKGDMIRIKNQEGTILGVGIASYDKQKAEEHQTDKKYKPLVHYDYMYLYL